MKFLKSEFTFIGALFNNQDYNSTETELRVNIPAKEENRTKLQPWTKYLTQTLVFR